MSLLKRLEIAGKLLLAVVIAALLYRPWRRRRARAPLRPRRVLLVRIDNRVGEALLTTPLFRALKALPNPPRVEVLVHPKVARVLTGHPDIDQLRPFDPRERLWGPFSKEIRALRRERYDVVVNCANWESPSVGPALVSRLVARDGVMIGPATAPVSLLADLNVSPRPDSRSEVSQRLHLLAPLGVDERARLSFRAVQPDAVVRGVLGALAGRPFAVVNPGGRLGWRRVPTEAFAASARALTEAGVVPLITWGPGEEPLAQETAAAVPGALIAPPTTIDQLAALMEKAKACVCNNTGPMHLAVAVGTPTLAFFLKMELGRWGHDYPPHRMVDLTPAADVVAAAHDATASFLTGSLDLQAKSP